MINELYTKQFCKDDISKIENYELAINDKLQTWHCHHRRETIYARNDLIEIGEYYNRPAMELIFLTPFEHRSLHCSLQFKGKVPWNKGKNLSDKTKKKISEKSKNYYSDKTNHPMYRKHHSNESRQKMRLSHKDKHKGKNNPAYNRHWYNNGIKNVFVKECPKGFVKGRIRKVEK